MIAEDVKGLIDEESELRKEDKAVELKKVIISIFHCFHRGPDAALLRPRFKSASTL
jgi:hypothetical protein